MESMRQWIQWTTESRNQWCNDLESQWFNESVNEQIKELRSQWFNDSVSQWASEAMNQCILPASSFKSAPIPLFSFSDFEVQSEFYMKWQPSSRYSFAGIFPTSSNSISHQPNWLIFFRGVETTNQYHHEWRWWYFNSHGCTGYHQAQHFAYISRKLQWS